MRVIQFHRYGPPAVLTLEQAPRPEPVPEELLVRVAAAGVNPKDCLIRKGKFGLITGRRFPQTLGQDFAGTVEACGARVEGFSRGDRVFGMVNRWRGGAYAEYISAPMNELAPMPGNISFEQAAAIPLAAQTALQALRDLGNLSAGDSVLINGAAGGVGSFAVQIARILGAEVTAVCSRDSTGMVERLGAVQIIDYRQKKLSEHHGKYQVVFDVFGNYSYPRLRHLLSRRGRYIHTVPKASTAGWHLATRWSLLHRALLVLVRSRRKDLELLGQWCAAGKLHPLIDSSYALQDAPQAHERVETRHAHGKVVLVP